MESKIISPNDKKVFRELVKQYAEVACLDVHANTVNAWKRLNNLRPERPMIMIDQILWQELNGSGELTTLCEDPFLKSLEIRMRQNLYKWRHFPCDMVLKPIQQVPKAVSKTGFGVQTKHRSENLNHAGASTHTYEDMIPDDEALLKLHPAEVAEDKAETKCRRDLVLELAGGHPSGPPERGQHLGGRLGEDRVMARCGYCSV
jgi:hypothetical protein